jgi:hypothetical protein
MVGKWELYTQSLTINISKFLKSYLHNCIICCNLKHLSISAVIEFIG